MGLYAPTVRLLDRLRDLPWKPDPNADGKEREDPERTPGPAQREERREEKEPGWRGELGHSRGKREGRGGKVAGKIESDLGIAYNIVLIL